MMRKANAHMHIVMTCEERRRVVEFVTVLIQVDRRLNIVKKPKAKRKKAKLGSLKAGLFYVKLVFLHN